MGPPPAVAPLPVAPDRAVLSNRIALLFAKQSALGRTLHRPAQHPSSSPSSPSATTTTSAPSSSFSSLSRGANPPPRAPDADDDDDERELRAAAANPNAGAGYVPEKSTDATARQDRALRSRLLGGERQQRRQAQAARQAVDSESDDDQGRSALGKRKRRAAEPREGPEARPSHPAALQGQAVEAPCGDDRTHEQPAAHLVEPSDAASKRRRNKKKRKNKASTSG